MSIAPIIEDITWYGIGDRCLNLAAGDVVFVRTNGIIGRGIRLVTRGWCNHVAMAVSPDNNKTSIDALRAMQGLAFHDEVGLEAAPSPDGHCGFNPNAHNVVVSQETPGSGDVLTPVDRLDAIVYCVVKYKCAPEQRRAVNNFALWAVGKRYGFMSIIADLINSVFRVEIDLGVSGRMTCSTQAASALSRTEYISRKNPSAMTPWDLAQDFGAVLEKEELAKLLRQRIGRTL